MDTVRGGIRWRDASFEHAGHARSPVGLRPQDEMSEGQDPAFLRFVPDLEIAQIATGSQRDIACPAPAEREGYLGRVRAEPLSTPKRPLLRSVELHDCRPLVTCPQSCTSCRIYRYLQPGTRRDA